MNKLIETIQNIKFIPLSIEDGIDEITSTVTDTTKLIVNRAVVPIAAIFLGALLIFAIVSLGKRRREGDDYSKQILAIVVLVILIALVLSAPTWLWTLIA